MNFHHLFWRFLCRGFLAGAAQCEGFGSTIRSLKCFFSFGCGKSSCSMGGSTFPSCLGVMTHMSHEKKPGWLGYIGDYTAQLYGEYQKKP